jgi:hypothetical protein
VRSPIAVRPVALAFPAEVSSTTATASYKVTFGYSGTYAIIPRGLIPAVTLSGTVADDPNDDFAGPGNAGTKEFLVNAPAGTTHVRFALYNDAMDGPHDLDLYVYEVTTAGDVLRALSAGAASDETAFINFNSVTGTTTARTYKVIVHGFDAVGGSANFTLFSWNVNNSLATTSPNMAVSAPSAAMLAGTGNIGLTFTGLAPATRYLGTNLHIQNGTTVVGTTVVSVKTAP